MKNITYISAGAGSGKTYTLTTTLADLISRPKDDPEHIEPEQVILTTFTVKAADEFREKAKAELYKMGKFEEASRLDNAMIGTIDSVASSLIEKYWYAIGLAYEQGVMDDSAKATYINQSIANVPSDDDLKFFVSFRKSFNIVDSNSKPNENYWKNHLKEIVEKSLSFDVTDYAASIKESLGILQKLCNGIHVHIEVDQRIAVLEAMQLVTEGCGQSEKKTKTLNSLASLKRFLQYMDDIEWWVEIGRIFKEAPSGLNNSTLSILDDARQKARDLWCSQEVYDLQEKYIRTIFRLAEEWREQYTQYKKNKRIVDFCDIEHYMYKLLKDDDVAAEIGRTYTHLFVDEFQDCSPIQVKVFMALANVVKKSYWVGDTKQAIYGFRGSDTLLTKAVSDAIAQKKGQDGCRYETLKESWRSVPTLVDACNKTFIEIFRPVFLEDTEELVPLKSAMALHPEKFKIKLEDRAKNPLRYLDVENRRTPRSPRLSVVDMAQYIKNVIDKEGVELSDIAVIARTGRDLDDIQAELANLHIESDRETLLNKESKACQLMMALTALTVNPHDDLAKASIVYLTQDNMGVGAIIDSKLEFDNTPKDERQPWLDDTEMINRVKNLRPSVMYQGIGALMETLAVELDVKNVMERWPEPIEESMTDVKALIAAAKEYEKRSSELAQPATPSGFVTFLSENEIKIPITGNGVQLLTYHGSKGLEWKYVFALLDENLDQANILSREFYGIHHFHPELPSATNLYPTMCIRLLPWIFGTFKNVPDSISQQLFSTEQYAALERHCREESARLLYVGMTRAEEVLTIVPWFKNKELDWLVQSGLPNAGRNDNGDMFGIGVTFNIVKSQFLTESEDVPADIAPKQYRKLDYHSDKPSDAGPLTIAPSGVKGKSNNIYVTYRSEEFIKVESGKLHGSEYSSVGDCIHNVYAAIEHLDKDEVEELISSHGMSEVLPYAHEVIRAWYNLQNFLKSEYGEPLAVYHERPFRQLQDDGTIVIGSIDYVYQTSEGTILIDYKTFPQVESITDPTSPHFAGHYAGQLNAYANALQANGEKVIKRFIYYPVSGMLVEIK